MSVEGRRQRGALRTVHARLGTALLLTTALSSGLFFLVVPAAPAAAQSSQAARSFDIGPQPLASALRLFADQSGMQLAYRTAELRGIQSPGFRGSAPNAQALARLLAGTGIDYRASGANTVTIQRPAAEGGAAGAAPAGAIALDTINVSGTGGSGLFGGGTPETPYSTPAPTAFISQESIERFRGSSPADIFRGTPGVMSGEARNGAGGIDPNIRGMQGMGRVAVTIDGAENGLTLHQGYQGISNRTFIDPDLIGGVDITKGASTSSRAIAGTVAVRTISANDVVKPGDRFGILVKSGFGTNTDTPREGLLGGYKWSNQHGLVSNPNLRPYAMPDGMSQPGLLNPTSGSGSVVAAWKEDAFDILAGYAHRKQGNYFAGNNGRGAVPIDTGPRPTCNAWTGCRPYYTNFFINGGLTTYRKGEEVRNTQLDTESYLLKGTVRLGDGHALQLGYNGFRSEAGDMFAARYGSDTSQGIAARQTSRTEVDSWTARYRWKPSDNDLIDLRANLWVTDLRLRGPIRSGNPSISPETFYLPREHRIGFDSRMWGADASNTSRWEWGRIGSFQLDYGASYLWESTHPTRFTDALNNIPSRHGKREEASVFTKLSYKPVDWLTLHTGIKYTNYLSHDLNVNAALNRPDMNNPNPKRKGEGSSPSAGILLEPWKGTQFYANYSSTLRMPSLFETVSSFIGIVNDDIKPERARNWDIGVNVSRDNVFADEDKAMIKFGYFSWNIKDYVSRLNLTLQHPSGYSYAALQAVNIPKAKFEGLEVSGRYEYKGFTADLAANYYTNIEFCESLSGCMTRTISADFATNQIPPQYQVSFTASQKLLNDRLTIGGRVTHAGPRNVKHGDPISGLATLIALVKWKPYYTVDAFAEYKLSESLTAWANVENLTDTYYVDPLSLVPNPAPGRIVRIGLTGKFGGSDPFAPISFADLFPGNKGKTDWTGFYVGGHSGYSEGRNTGTMTAADGSMAGYPALERPNKIGRGFVFGANAGYNYHLSNGIVAGIEGDIVKPQTGHSQFAYAVEGSNRGGIQDLYLTRQLEAVRASDIEWLSTIRGRLGFALTDNLMIYGTGGIAFAEQVERRTQFATMTYGTSTLAVAQFVTVPSFTETDRVSRVGFAIGGGVEYAIGDGWSVKGEYLLNSFQTSKTFSFPDARLGVVSPAARGSFPVTYTTINGRKMTSTLDVPLVKLGVNYRF
ncbi:TonB-dependent receptor domain-containing protein [Enterovirga rhinocerotis]|uniref:Hemoglobin/transferrin/lactoferrin receptor protein n=1 Tax=Enterovirga rhinocerotis TaxID=1339210 RepID=A0A4R7BJ84_9HYPH|nr:TonB-dependent receptor [Enterovirga rhinocerotis]TDR84522.1 hemoglobin/transferrin/lactoferrin receptor protein [Enterovirga rhinocerotis]